MPELKRSFRIFNTLMNVVRRERHNHRHRSDRIDLPSNHKVSCDGSNNLARISIGQCHPTTACHLGCERLQVGRLPAEYR